MNLIPYVVIWAALAVIVLVMGIVRNLGAMHEDDNIHVSAGEAQMIPKQVSFIRRLESLERWGKTLTIVTLVGGIALAILYLLQAWNASMMPR